MRSGRWNLSVVLVLCVVFLWVAWAKAEASRKAGEDDIVIGFSVGTLREERWIRDTEMFTAEAKKRGANVNVLFAGNDSLLQLSQIESLILQRVDVLVVVPQDAKAMSAVVDKAHKAGIKVIAYDRLIRDCDIDFYVSFDNVKVGELEAKGVLEAASKGEFAYIGGAETDNNAFLLKQGSMAVLEPLIKSGELTLVVDTFCQDWKPEEAYKAVKHYLEKGGKLTAVIAANDGTAFGVIQALKEFGLAGKVPVSGQDAELGGCQRVVEGTQTMTVYKPIRLLSSKAAEVAVAFARGEEVESNSLTENGKKNVPTYLLEPVAVNKDTMVSTIVKDGYHTYEQVYKNVMGK